MGRYPGWSDVPRIECPFYREERKNMERRSCEICCQYKPGCKIISQRFGKNDVQMIVWKAQYCQNFPGYKECWIYKYLWGLENEID